MYKLIITRRCGGCKYEETLYEDEQEKPPDEWSFTIDMYTTMQRCPKCNSRNYTLTWQIVRTKPEALLSS